MLWFLLIAWTGLCIVWTITGFGWPLLPPGWVSESIPLGPFAELDVASQSKALIVTTWIFGIFLIAGLYVAFRK